MKIPNSWTTNRLTALLPVAVMAILGCVIAFGWEARQARPSAGALAAGIAALDANDYAAAHRVFQTLADKNEPAAELWLAHLYQDGLGVAPNAQQAATLLTKAANAGSAPAAERLGKLYLDGDGVLQDPVAAKQWLSRAAQQGDAVAQRELGRLYAQGLGTAKDPRKAYVWLDIAARNGDAQASQWRDKVLATLTPADAAHAAADAAEQLRLLTADARGGAPAAKTARDSAGTATHDGPIDSALEPDGKPIALAATSR
jgi:TPR repeat protein